MKDYRKELLKYCEITMKSDFTSPTTKKNWAFGAIDFAYGADLIDKTTYMELAEKYQLF